MPLGIKFKGMRSSSKLIINKTKASPIEQAYDNVAKGIVYQAITDYMTACRTLNNKHDTEILRKAKDTKEECERFFSSEECEYLSGLEKGMILKGVEELINEGIYSLNGRGFMDGFASGKVV